MNKNLYFLLHIVLIFSLQNCQVSFVTSPRKLKQLLQKDSTFQNSFHGLSIYDLEKQAYIFEYQADKYFIPASNTKLFTFFAGLKLLPAQTPALWYVSRKDSLLFWGTSNPAMLDPILRDTVAYSFLKNRKENLYFSARNFDETYFGFGWNWGDYPYSYAAEKSVLPIYGNLIQLKAAPQEKLSVFPALFQDSIQIKSLEKPNLWDALRAPANNQILLTLHPQDTVLVDVPLHTSAYLAARLLQDTLHKPVYLTHAPLSKDAQILYSFPADSLYKAMLQPSDNFLAEHILLMAGNYLPDSLRVRGLNTQRTIDFVRRTYLKSLTHSPQWLDGSGLSRTNLFTPHSLVELLLMIYKEVAKDTQGEKRLFSLLAIGGKAGTLKNLYKKYPSFIFGKTGTLQNNHNLSGYLITKSGKKLCFSFMHNHFLTKTSAIREKMEKILTEFYLKY